MMEHFEAKTKAAPSFKAEAKKESLPPVESAVVKKRCKVLSYNKKSHIMVYERDDGHVIQITASDYDGSGYIEIE